MTRHRRSALYGDGIMEDYFLLYSIHTFLFNRTIAVRQLTFVVLPDNNFWNIYMCSNALHDQSLGTRMGTWNAQVRCTNAVAMTSYKATNRPHPIATSFTLALWQQHWKATNGLFMTVSVFDFRCYSLEKQKCCECFASIDGDKGDGIYCVKYVQLIINTPFFHRGFLCIPCKEQERGKAFFLTLEWSLKLLRKLMAN